MFFAASLVVSVPVCPAFGFQSLSSVFTAPGGTVPHVLPAGSHPGSWTVSFSLDTSGPPGEEVPDGDLKDLRIELPPGAIGTTESSPRCSREDFLEGSCPPATAVGIFTADLYRLEPLELPLYLLEPRRGTMAELGFEANQLPLFVELSISSAPPYGLVAEVTNSSQAAALLGASMTLEGVSGGVPLLTLPRRCAPPLRTGFAVRSWEAPSSWLSDAAPELQTLADCSSLAYAPALRVSPTTAAAAALSGLDLDLDAPDSEIGSANGRAAADTRSAAFELPPGMSVNPSAAAGLASCTPAQLASARPESAAGAGCPEAAKVGDATVLTPLLEKPIEGDLYVAQPDNPATVDPREENPFDTLLALYLIFRDPDRGVLFSLPIRIEADPSTGRLNALFDRIPELPISHLTLHLDSGPRAPLTTPRQCGAHSIRYTLTPSSGNPPLEGEQTFRTSSGCDPAFAPELAAGTASNAAGSAAPFVLEMRNAAGAPNLEDIALTLPPGLAANLAGVATCPEADVATASCPIASRLGFARIALGAGPEPLWVPGGAEPDSDVFLAGPYRGAPFSLLVAIPATAGPFDLGRVVLRAPARVDPRTGQLTFELAGLPQIREGIPIQYRTIRLVLDRPGFVRNPTSCAPMPIELTATGAGGTVASAISRYQAADCAALGFRPQLSVRLAGGLGRNGHPRVGLRFATRPRQANLAGGTFDFPAGELLDVHRLRALCSRELRAAECPPASRLGNAIVRTPLLAEPLRGPVYLRAPGARYPGMLAELQGGGVRILLHGRIGSAAGGRLRIRLTGLPDIPLSEAAIHLDGGGRGIVVNSASLCSRRLRAAALLRGHNGKRSRLRPRLRLHGSC